MLWVLYILFPSHEWHVQEKREAFYFPHQLECSIMLKLEFSENMEFQANLFLK